MRSLLLIWSHLLKISLMENFIFCAVSTLKYFEKLALKQKKKKRATLNGCIWKATVNSESKLTFYASSFNFLQNTVVFCTLYPRGYTTGGSFPYSSWCHCQRLAELKDLRDKYLRKHSKWNFFLQSLFCLITKDGDFAAKNSFWGNFLSLHLKRI